MERTDAIVSQSHFNPQNIKAMIVDDQDPIRKAMKGVLSRIGIKHIIECFDGGDAIKELSRQPVDIILLDLFLKKVDGFEVLQFVRNRSIGSDIPVIIVTGESTKESIVKASDFGADDYMVKPFQVDGMTTKVTNVLNQFFNPPDILKKLREGDRFLMNQEYDAALKAYESALSLDKTSMRASYSRALALDACGNTDDAIQLLHENIHQASSYYKNYQALGNIHIRNGNFLDAVKYLMKELELNPKQPSRQVQLAKILTKQGDTLTAIEHYKLALKENSKDKNALIEIAKALASIEEIEKSLAYFKRARRHHATDTNILKHIVKICMDAEKPKLAEAALKEEKNLHPERLDTYSILAQFQMSLNQDADAIKTITDLLKIDPKNLDGMNTKGHALMKQGDFQNALVVFDDLMKISPNIENMIAYSKCLFQLGQLKDCIDKIHQVLNIEPSHGAATFLLANAYKRSMQFAKAAICFLRALSFGYSKDLCLPEITDCQKKLQERRQKPQISVTD